MTILSFHAFCLQPADDEESELAAEVAFDEDDDNTHFGDTKGDSEDEDGNNDDAVVRKESRRTCEWEEL